MPFADADQSAILEVSVNLSVNFTATSDLDSVYVEAAMHLFQSGAANEIQIIPAGRETLALDPPNL